MAGGNGIKAGKAYVEISAVDKTAKALSAIQKKVAAMGAAMSAAGVRMMGAGAAMTAPFAMAAKSFDSVGSQINGMSMRTGIGAEALQGLSFAAQQNSASIEDVEGGIKKMSRTITDAGEGSQAAADALAMLGLTYNDMAGKSPDEQFALIAEQISKVDDATTKLAASQEIFGRSGNKLIPMMAGGAQGLRAYTDEAKKLGLVLSREDVAAAAAFGDEIGKMKMQVQAAWLLIGAAVAGAIMPYVGAIKEALASTIQWISANRGIVVAVAAIAASVLAAGAGLFVLGQAVAVVAAGFGVLAGVITALMSPIGIVVGLLAAAGYAWLNWTESGAAAADTIKTKMGEVAETVKTAWGGIVNAMKSGDIGLAAKIGFTAVKIAALEVFGPIRDAWRDLVFGMQALWQTAIAGIENATSDLFLTLNRGANAVGLVDDEDLKKIEQFEANRRAEREARYGQDMSALVDENSTGSSKALIESLKKELAALNQTAANQAAAVTAPTAPDKKNNPNIELPEQTAQRISAFGTFNKIVGGEFGGNLGGDKITMEKQTAKNTKKIVEILEDGIDVSMTYN